MRRGLRWVAAVAAGVVVFEGMDLLASSAITRVWVPAAESLPAASPLVAGALAAWWASPHPPFALLASASTVWARIGVDRGLGALRGARLPPEAGWVLVLAFGAPWTAAALAGGAVAAAARWLIRRTACGAPRRSGDR